MCKHSQHYLNKFKGGDELKKVRSKTGKTVILLNPAERGKKFANELKHGYAKTNDNKTKRDDKGKAVKLTDEQRAFRSGYLQSRTDSAKAYKSKTRKKK